MRSGLGAYRDGRALPVVKFLVAGLGSAGQRHVRNLRRLRPDAEIVAWRVRGWNLVLNDRLDASEGRPEDAYGLRVVRTLEQGLAERPDAVVIANPISMHMETALASVAAGASVFIEKPLSDRWDGVEELIAASEQRRLSTFVGYQTRFHPAIRRVKELLESGALGRPLSAHLRFGEYLPGMHPYEDYRDSHASRRREGGGVILCLSHEIDLALWLFGMPAAVFASGGHLSGLDMDVEDVAHMILDCRWRGERLPVSVALDFVQRPPQRGGEVVCDAGTVRWNLLEPSVSVFEPRRGEWAVERFPGFERNQLFIDEMTHFLACVEERESALIPAAVGAQSLRIALSARESLEAGAPVSLASFANAPSYG